MLPAETREHIRLVQIRAIARMIQNVAHAKEELEEVSKLGAEQPMFGQW